MARARFLLLAMALLAGSAAPALAHAFLARASPAVGGTVLAAPDRLELWFTEAVELAFSKVTVADGAGKPVAVGALTADPGDDTKVIVALPKLASGTYMVTWHVVSVDTHRTSGSFSFTVGP